MRNIIKEINIKRIEIGKIDYIEKMYILGVLIYTLKALFIHSLIISFDGNLATLTYILVLVFTFPKIVFNDYTKKELIFVVLLFIFTFLCMVLSKTANIILVPIILVGTKNSDIKTIVKYIFYLTLCTIFLHLSLYFFTEIKKGTNVLSLFTLERPNYRPTIMYEHNNAFCMVVTTAIMQYIFITDRNQKRYIKVICIFAVMCFAYLLGQSNTSFIIAFLALIYMILENINFFERSISVCKTIALILSVGFSLSMLFIDGSSKFGIFINKCLTGRVQFVQEAYERVGISIIPQPLMYDEMVLIPVDNCYMSIFLKWGIVFSFIFLIFVIVLGFINKNDNIANYYLSIVFIWGIMENVPKLITMTIVPIVLFNTFFKNNNYFRL